MRVVIVGSGGREHAIGVALARGGTTSWIGALPGNPGLASLGPCFADSVDAAGVLRVASAERADLVVIGPEAPLAAGMADALRARGVAVFGPSAAAARIESSKAFARAFLERHGVPGARFRVFAEPEAARAFLADIGIPCVVKADGLAAGKGAFVCRTREEAEAAIHGCLSEGTLGEAGRSIVIESFLEGEEVSLFVLTDGETALPLVASQDHKAIRDRGEGPNTGGMGAYAPWPPGDAAFVDTVMARIITPTIEGLRSEGAPFSGCLYAGLMITKDGPRVVEFNARFGDPETQVVLPLLKGDLAPLLHRTATGTLDGARVAWRTGAAVSVVLASEGYPGRSPRGRVITGIEQAARRPGVDVYHAGTASDGGRLVTAGGRVLAVTAVADGLAAARERAYEAVTDIRFDGMQFRRDIALKGLAHVA